ncbi:MULTISPECIES: hypothetical protein [Streptococcus]|jgi:putative uncharacterized protein orf8|uniref:hypothetical protein n=1 Tax=Streptococcus TaxID=1301 RepID=UPI000660C594|nr:MULTISPECIES: hypothetical protein [Streptococcus]KTF20474.1 hypothetical protein AT460_06680 [Streptococcus gordonii]KXC04337.1 hypothetical protein AWH02_00660 [Streptococcus gordonii]MBZ2150321.1 hypothetical protein [Streptococcus gordonii]MCB6406284.1 hypothetical protein [Streptococcus gordonii]MDN5021327.1 hypothetical protein [Streptococcus sp. SG2]
MQYTTLTQFIDEQCTKLNLKKDQKTLMKMRTKFVRTLKELGIWEKAETRLIDRSKTKVFTNAQLYELHQAVRPYLLKLLPEHERLEIEQTQENNLNIIKEHIDEVETKLTLSMENYDLDEYKKYIEKQYEPPIPTQEEINSLMLEALFLKFFEPINIKQWSDDLALIDFIDPYDSDEVTDIINIKAQNRLKDKIKAYVKEKKD